MLIIPALLTSFNSLKDKTVKLVFETNEPTPEQSVEVFSKLHNFGYLAFKDEPFTDSEKQLMDNLSTDFEDKKKSQSKRIRNVLYVYFSQDPQGFESFDSFYNHYTEKFIEHIKSKLE